MVERIEHATITMATTNIIEKWPSLKRSEVPCIFSNNGIDKLKEIIEPTITLFYLIICASFPGIRRNGLILLRII